MSKEKFNVTPDIRLLEAIGSASYAAPDAVCELIANSFDARPNEEVLVIDVSVGSGVVSIVDNGIGMTKKILSEAMRLSADMDKVTGNTKTRKGMYGLGMKAACSSLGFKWEIITRHLDDPKNDLVLHLDLKNWLSKSERDSWEIEIETIPRDKKGPLGSRAHGTAITVSALRDGNPMPGAIIEKISQAYGPHLASGDRILVNGQLAHPREFNLEEDRRWEIDLRCGDSGEYRITGWVGLDSKTHNDGLYGINIFRHGQLVDAWNKKWFRAHLMTSRIVGQVNLDFVAANFHKQGFDTTSVEWKLATEVMTTFLKPVAKASGDMSQGKKDPSRKTKAIQALDGALGVARSGQVGVPGLLVSEDNDADSKVEDKPIGKKRDRREQIGGSLQNLEIEEHSFTLSFDVEVLDDASIPWDYIYDDGDLLAILNSESTLYKSFNRDFPALGTIALSECVVAFLVKERGIEFSKAKEIRDRWLHVALGGMESQ